MKICVFGLWHLGSVTAACLASKGFQVVGLDPNQAVVDSLNNSTPPLFEPKLQELISKGLHAKQLSFTTDVARAVKGADIIWVTFDTPVNDQDEADVSFVTNHIKGIFPYVSQGSLILVSSQLPVGTIATLEKECPSVSFAGSPENLRLGKAVSVFCNPDRVVLGVRKESDKARLKRLFLPFTKQLEWMSVESAEMTKHALNAFLATSVVFINEIATLCEQAGADAKEVERGLKTEARIGSKAYLSPGGAFAGGTLARDIAFLKTLGQTHSLPLPMLSHIPESNEWHKQWTTRKLLSLLIDLQGKTIAIWGLTYKPGTDTLRRSGAIELCQWLVKQGATIQAHDPVVKELPFHLNIRLCKTPAEATHTADALIIATQWPEYKNITAEEIRCPCVIDPNRFLADIFMPLSHIQYYGVGSPTQKLLEVDS